MFVPRSSALLLSALPSASSMSVPVLRLFAFLLSIFPSTSGMSMPVPRLSAPSSVSSMFGVFIPMPRSLIPPSMSDVLVPVPELSPLQFPT